jgi:hypothetical protein
VVLTVVVRVVVRSRRDKRTQPLLKLLRHELAAVYPGAIDVDTRMGHVLYQWYNTVRSQQVYLIYTRGNRMDATSSGFWCPLTLLLGPFTP